MDHNEIQKPNTQARTENRQCAGSYGEDNTFYTYLYTIISFTSYFFVLCDCLPHTNHVYVCE